MATTPTVPRQRRPKGLKLRPEKCLACKKKQAKHRGLCDADYQAAIRSIKAGETNWVDLIALGLARESRSGQGPRPNALRQKLKAAKQAAK